MQLRHTKYGMIANWQYINVVETDSVLKGCNWFRHTLECFQVGGTCILIWFRHTVC